jgi:signal transduction histidine kinase
MEQSRSDIVDSRLRSLLAAVAGFLDLLEERWDEMDDHGRRTMLSDARQAAGGMTHTLGEQRIIVL